MPNTLTGTLTRNMRGCTKADNPLHITTSRVVHMTFGTNAGLLRKVRSSQVLGVVLMLALVLSPGYLSAQSCPPGSVQPPPGLVAWWPLDETGGITVSDHSGLGNLGTASATIGSSLNPRSVTGFVGNGLNFFLGSRVRVSPSPSLNFGSTAATNTSFTIDAWIKGLGGPIVSNFNLSTKLGYTVSIANNTLRLEMGRGFQVMTWNWPAITPNAWTFVAVVVDRSSSKVTLYTGSTSLSASVPSIIPTNAFAYSGLPLVIGGCAGNPGVCNTIIDEVEIFNRALTKPELQSIFNAGSAGKCIPQRKGMTWIHTASNAQTGTITIGCGSTGPNPCDAINGDTVCTQLLPLLCIYKPAPPLPLPTTGVSNADPNNQWSGGVVATTPPHVGTFLNITAANSYCATQFGTGWRVAEFHDGAGWNFQAYGGTVSAPAVPSTRFWVYINDQSANCW